MYVGSHIKKFANRIGLKLYVSKHEEKTVLNIYDIEADRLLVNYDGYGGKYIRGKHKLLNAEQFNQLPLTISNEQQLLDLIVQVESML